MTPSNQPIPKRRSTWHFGLIGCSVAITFMVVVFVAIIVVVAKTPYMKGRTACKSNIQKVGDAVSRYAIKNDVYPDDLKQLVPDYIPAKVLRCPIDNTTRGAITYVYHKPPTGAAGSFAVLECNYHTLQPSTTQVRIVYQKNGEVVDKPTDSIETRR